MKERLLALMLVLGMASMANATLSLVVGDGTTFTDPGEEFTIDIGDTIWIGVNDSVGEDYYAQIANPHTNIGEWTGNTAVYSPPAYPIDPTPEGWEYNSNQSGEWWYVYLQNVQPGVGGAVEFRGLSEGDVGMFLNLGPVSLDDKFTLHIVPAPATLFLLGFGGLTLLRKKCRVKE